MSNDKANNVNAVCGAHFDNLGALGREAKRAYRSADRFIGDAHENRLASAIQRLRDLFGDDEQSGSHGTLPGFIEAVGYLLPPRRQRVPVPCSDGDTATTACAAAFEMLCGLGSAISMVVDDPASPISRGEDFLEKVEANWSRVREAVAPYRSIPWGEYVNMVDDEIAEARLGIRDTWIGAEVRTGQSGAAVAPLAIGQEDGQGNGDRDGAGDDPGDNATGDAAEEEEQTGAGAEEGAADEIVGDVDDEQRAIEEGGGDSSANDSVRANTSKLFSAEFPNNEKLKGLAIRLDQEKNSDKSMNQIAHEFTKENPKDKKTKALSLLSRLRKQKDKTYFPD